MSSGESYAVSDVACFKDPTSSDGLNKVGKYFRHRDRLATGFNVLLVLVIFVLAILGAIYIPKWNRKRKEDKEKAQLAAAERSRTTATSRASERL